MKNLLYKQSLRKKHLVQEEKERKLPRETCGHTVGGMVVVVAVIVVGVGVDLRWRCSKKRKAMWSYGRYSTPATEDSGSFH